MATLQSQFGWLSRMQAATWISVAVIGGAIYTFGIRPALNERARVVSATDVQRREIASSRGQVILLPSLERDVVKLQARLATMERQLPRKPDMDQFMRDINRISESAALKKLTVQPGSPRRHDKINEMPIGLTFNGDFANVVQFLRQTEALQRLSRVRSLAIKSSSATAGGVNVDLVVSLFFADE